MQTLPDYIPLTDCIAGHLYRLYSRNLVLGVFDGQNGFAGVREKFGRQYLFTEYHWDTGPPHGTACPLEDVGVVPEGIPLGDNLPSVCSKTGRAIVWDQEADQPLWKGRWIYADTRDPIPAYPESHAVYPHNKALWDFILPLDVAERAR